MKIRKPISLSELEELIKMFGLESPVEELGHGLYRLPGGVITGKNGVKMFMKLLDKEHGGTQ